VYDREIAQIDKIADAWLLRAVRTGRAEAAHKHEFRGRKPAVKTPHGGRAQPRRARTAKLHGKKLALVLDIDETSLSNYSAIVADNFTFGTNSQNEAVNKIGVAIAPTLELFNLAKRNGVAVFLITGRPEAQRQPTIENLQREGYSDWTGLTLKPPGTTLTTVAYKTGARAAIEQQGYRIIASVGDQYSDLAGGHEDKAFKLPNPFYFLP
jgi:predicted secreted acid phosphatase